MTTQFEEATLKIVFNSEIINEGMKLSIKTGNKIYFNIFKNYQKKIVQRKAAIDILKTIMEELEKDLKKTISNHSALFWFQLTRRFSTNFWLKFTQSISTAFLARQTFELAVVKFGKYDTDDIFESKSKRLFPKFNNNDLIHVIYLIHLCCHYYSTTAIFRRINKGDKMKIIDNYNFELIKNPSLDKMMKLNDLRNDNFLGLFSLFAHIDEHRSKIDSPAILYAFSSFNLSDSLSHEFNFINSSELKELLHFWQRIGVSIKGFSISQLIALLSTLFHWHLSSKDQDIESKWNKIKIEIQEKGYSTIKLGVLSNEIKLLYPEIYNLITGSNQSFTKAEIDTDVNRFFHIFTDKANINLLRRSNAPLFIKFDRLEIIDWTKITNIIREWIDDLTESSFMEIASERGTVFQEEVKKYIEKECPSLAFWPSQREFLYRHKSRVAQIDIGCIKDSILFLIECKIKFKNSNYTSGEKIFEDSLWKAHTDWLKQVDKTAEILKNSAHLKNGEMLPDNIRYIVPIICTNLIMFIRSQNPYFFLTNKIPRVCTPRELTHILNSKDIDFLNCPAVLKINRE